jgi:L-arabonate dehydrase
VRLFDETDAANAAALDLDQPHHQRLRLYRAASNRLRRGCQLGSRGGFGSRRVLRKQFDATDIVDESTFTQDCAIIGADSQELAMKKLRSQEWFGRQDKNGFMYRSWMKNQGWPHDLFEGRPVIGICNTWSELTPCNGHFRELAEFVKRGVWEAGGFPLEFPVMSLGESVLRPTAMLFRNLASMDVEESIRGNPIDGVVLLMGCDKTCPSLLMGAASCDLPTIGLSGGPMLSGKYRGCELGSGTGIWQMSEQVRAGELKIREFFEAESCMHRSKGHCMTMGTASTMASMVEALGMSLPGNAAIPAVDARRNTLAQMTGRRIVEMIREDLCISKILTRDAFENAIRINAAIGGSTNAVIHLIALAGRVGIPLSLDDFDHLGNGMPCLVNIQPSGDHLMEDFFYAGGLPAVLRELGEAGVLKRDALTVTGRSLWSNVNNAPCWNRDIIRSFAQPFKENAGIAVLRGNLAPDGAVIKLSAASPRLLQHRGRAVVFESIEDFHSHIDDETLEVDQDSVMVLKNCGPRGYPGMAEVGNMPLPRKLLRHGVTDMVRISDARMSGTAYGTVVLHASPEAAVGGPLAFVQSGDFVTLDVPKRLLQLEVDDNTISQRRERWAPPPVPKRGWEKLYAEHVLQAHQGADLDFLVGRSGAGVARDSH